MHRIPLTTDPPSSHFGAAGGRRLGIGQKGMGETEGGIADLKFEISEGREFFNHGLSLINTDSEYGSAFPGGFPICRFPFIWDSFSMDEICGKTHGDFFCGRFL